MTHTDYQKQTDELSRILADLFVVGAVYRQENNIIFSLDFRFEKEKSIEAIKDRLKTAGYNYKIHQQEESLLLSINPERSTRIPMLNIVLFVATLISVYIMPVLYDNFTNANTFGESIRETISALRMGEGIQFTIAIISILFIHEMGHYVAGRRRQIITSWPYFIPAPNFIGTFGAIIKSKSPFWNRRDLIEVGAAGPIAGWVVSVIWLFYGMTQSVAVPIESLLNQDNIILGDSIIFRIAISTMMNELPTGQVYSLSEAVFAGWVGLLVTAINLLPMGQLDGGHILYGIAPKKQELFGRIALAILILLGFQSPMWWFFAAFGLFFGVKHPPTLNDQKPLSRVALLMAIVSIAIMFLSFTPVPFR